MQQERTISDMFEQQQSGKTLIDMLELDLIVGSGGILSHAPRRVQSMLMMVDAYEPLGVTRLSVDSIFMMPHLGVLSTVNEKAATDVFVRDCMVYLGTCVAPIGQGKDGERCADYAITFPDGRVDKGQLSFGDLRLFPLASGQKASITIQPAKQVNLGAGAGVAVTREVHGGVVGLLLDGRGRPLQLPTDQTARVAALTRWFRRWICIRDAESEVVVLRLRGTEELRIALSSKLRHSDFYCVMAHSYTPGLTVTEQTWSVVDGCCRCRAPCWSKRGDRACESGGGAGGIARQGLSPESRQPAGRGAGRNPGLFDQEGRRPGAKGRDPGREQTPHQMVQDGSPLADHRHRGIGFSRYRAGPVARAAARA